MVCSIAIALLNGGATIVDDTDFEAVCKFPWRLAPAGQDFIYFDADEVTLYDAPDGEDRPSLRVAAATPR